MPQQFYINLHVVVPMRREPRESSEMVSQLVFGEFGKILDTNGSFIYIENYFDSYKGWVDAKMILPISEKEFEKLLIQPVFRVNVPIADAVDESDKSTMRLIGSSILPFYDTANGLFSFRDKYKYKINSCFVNKIEPKNAEVIVSTAKLFLHSPYLWGGKNAFGIDCSGFVQVVFSINGYLLPRDASQQIKGGGEINLSNAKAGDLAFFEKNGKITHVGILLSSEEIIHASGQVKIEKIDEIGIISSFSGKYSHQLATIKRLI